MGFGIGGGGIKASANTTETDPEYGKKLDISAMHNTLDWGIMGGYRHFFMENFGARFYANLVVIHLSNSSFNGVEFSGVGGVGGMYLSNNIPGDTNVFFFNYTANADLIYNFYKWNNTEFGAFVGLSLGGSSINVVNSFVTIPSMNFFDIGINFGVRSQFSHNHGIELAVKVPFLPLVKMPDRYTAYSYNNQPITIDINVELRQSFSLMMRYVYSFGDEPKPVRAVKKVKRRAVVD